MQHIFPWSLWACEVERSSFHANVKGIILVVGWNLKQSSLNQSNQCAVPLQQMKTRPIFTICFETSLMRANWFTGPHTKNTWYTGWYSSSQAESHLTFTTDSDTKCILEHSLTTFPNKQVHREFFLSTNSGDYIHTGPHLCHSHKILFFLKFKGNVWSFSLASTSHNNHTAHTLDCFITNDQTMYFLYPHQGKDF